MVELDGGFVIFGGFCPAGAFADVEDGDYFGWKAAAEGGVDAGEGGHVGGGSAEDELAEARGGGLGQGVFGGEHAAPGVAEEVVAGDAEGADKVGELGGEEGGVPEGCVAFTGGEARGADAADLVVHEDGDAVVVGEEGEREEVVMDGAGAAVEADEGGDAGGEVAPEGVVGFAEVAGRGDLKWNDAGFGGGRDAAFLPGRGREVPAVHLASSAGVL